MKTTTADSARMLKPGHPADQVNLMRPLVRNTVSRGEVCHFLLVMFATSIACCGLAQGTAGWADAKVTKTDLLTGATLVGIVSGDNVTLDTNSAAGSFANANVGTGKYRHNLVTYSR